MPSDHVWWLFTLRWPLYTVAIPPSSCQPHHLPFLIVPVPCLPQDLYTGWARCLLLGNRPTRCPSMSSQEALPHCSVCHLLCVWDQNVLPSMSALSLTTAATPQQQRPVYRRCSNKACEIKERIKERL